MNLRLLRLAVIAVCVVGIAGMIIGSLADNNNGAVITFGLITAVSILVLMAVAATTRAIEGRAAAAGGPPEVDEELAADIEARIQVLVTAGADEATVRALVGQAVKLGRGPARSYRGPRDR